MIKPGPRPNRGERNLTKKEDGWHIEFQFHGKRIRRFGGYSKEQARNALAKLRLDLINEDLGFKKPVITLIPFEIFADEFLLTYCKQNKRSWKRDEILLNNLKRHFKGASLQTIGPEQVEQFKAQCKTEMVEHFKATKKTPIKPATINREITCLKTLFNKAVEWGRIDKNPIVKVRKFKEPPPKEHILTDAEAQRLIKSASASIQPILIIALSTGIRLGDILGLKWENVFLERGYIFIEDSKSGRSRKVPINAALLETLRALSRDSEFLFYNHQTKKHIQTVTRAFKVACVKAKKDPEDKEDPGIVGLRFHDLRHTAASKMIETGIDLVTVSKILGHASAQTTLRYAHPTPENMRRAVDRLADMLNPSRQKVTTATIQKPATPSNQYN